MCYLCPGNIRGPGTCLSRGNPGRLSLLRCCCQGGRGKSQLPEPHSLYGALLSPASADCRGLPAPLLLRLLPPPSLLLSPSAILLEVLKLLTRFPQWPGVYRAPPSPRPHPHPREQRPDFPGGANQRRSRGWGTGQFCPATATQLSHILTNARARAEPRLGCLSFTHSTGGPVQDSRALRQGWAGAQGHIWDSQLILGSEPVLGPVHVKTPSNLQLKGRRV